VFYCLTISFISSVFLNFFTNNLTYNLTKHFYTLEALALAIESCKDGADIYEVCQKVDAFIEEELGKTFSSKKSKKLERGIAFPCCISVNEICGHFSPLKDDSLKLKLEDLVKVEIGAHIDGFPASCAHSFVIGGKTKGK